MIYQFEIFKNLNYSEKRTFGLHLTYSIIEGIILGVIALNEFVFVKSLQGSNGLLSVLFSFSVIVLVVSIFLNEYLKRYRGKRKLLFLTALVTRLPLLGLMFFPENPLAAENPMLFHYLFLGIFFFFFLAQPIVLPIINLFLKNNYSHGNFGRLYSYSTMINKIIMMVVTFFTGRFLDLDPFAFRYIYPVVGILGILSIIILAMIRTESQQEVIRVNLASTFRNSFRNMLAILKSNKPYLDFEIGFMLYGLAFMTSAVMITLFYNNALHLNYSSVAFYKNFYNIIAIIFLPLFGRLLGKLDPRKFAMLTFGFLFMTILFTMLCEYIPDSRSFISIEFVWLLIVANIFYGLFAGAMPLLWNIGSAYFCKEGDVATYQAIHLSLTGFRGMIAPFIGVMVYGLSNFTFTFSLGLASLIAGIMVMGNSLKKYKRH